MQTSFTIWDAKTVGLVGLWDCVAFDEVAGIKFKDKDGIQIMKDYMASGSFARGKEEKAATASMVFVGNINQSVDVLLKTSSLVCTRFRRKWEQIRHFLTVCTVIFRAGRYRSSDRSILPMITVLSVIICAEFIRELRKEQYGDALDHYFRLGKKSESA